jgi:hypothetical protein
MTIRVFALQSFRVWDLVRDNRMALIVHWLESSALTLLGVDRIDVALGTPPSTCKHYYFLSIQTSYKVSLSI